MQLFYFNVKDFGARGDGIYKDTLFIQMAIDDAAQGGGGTIYFPPGTYLTGSISLKSHISLKFAPGATLLASIDRQDYPEITGGGDSRYRDASGKMLWEMSALLYGYMVQDISIEGGLLTSDDEAFWLPSGSEEDFESAITTMPWHFYRKRPWRVFMFMLEDCKDIRVNSLRIERYPVYAGWMLGCQNVSVSNLAIRSNPAGPNTDGLHFTSCQDVRIFDSSFFCGDDCIAIDGNHRGSSENFSISGCTFETTVHAFRIYTGLDPGMRDTGIPCTVRNVTINGCCVKNACGILSLNADGGNIENISLSNICASLDWEGTPFLLSARNGSISRILMSGFAVEANGFGIIRCSENAAVKYIDISHFTVEITPKTKIDRGGKGFVDHCHHRANNLVMTNAQNITLSSVRITWKKPLYSDTWTPVRRKRLQERVDPELLQLAEPLSFKAYEIENCHNIVFDNVDMPDFDIT